MLHFFFVLHKLTTQICIQDITKELRAKGADDDQVETVEEDQPVDLNGVSPFFAFGGTSFTAFLSFLFWRITIGMATHFNGLHINTDFYPIQRLVNVASTVFVGMAALGAGVTGMTALGLFLLSCKITIGVATGELDPNKKRAPAPRDLIPKDDKGLPKFNKPWYEETFDK